MVSAPGEVTPADVAGMMAAAKQTSGVVVAPGGSMQPLEAAQLGVPAVEAGEDG